MSSSDRVWALSPGLLRIGYLVGTSRFSSSSKCWTREGDVATELRITGAIDLAHAARAERADDFHTDPRRAPVVSGMGSGSTLLHWRWGPTPGPTRGCRAWEPAPSAGYR